MAVSLNSVIGFNSTLRTNCQHVSKSSNGGRLAKDINFTPGHLTERSSRRKTIRRRMYNSVSKRYVVATETTDSNVPPVPSKPDNLPELQPTLKRTPLTAREKLKAARVVGRNTESRASRSKVGSSVLDSLIESDRGKKRSGLPEAPSNMLDDSKRGMPAPGWTFSFPGGADLFFIIFSFVFISSVMFATTYFVWKVGAIHFMKELCPLI